MKKFLTICLLFIAGHLTAQQYNNEWINFNQTYYKFKVVTTGLYRINQPVLAAAGLGSAQVQFLQLWRNGQEVPFYSNVASGPLTASDYIEFWGEGNDGKPDKPLYRDPAFQHSDKISLSTDTVAYFLTVRSVVNNNRITQIPNNTAANSLPAETSFWHKEGSYFRGKINAGFAAVVGEYVYSSSYDKGEYWASSDIYPTTNFTDNKSNLFVAPTGPDPVITFGASGNALNPRSVKVLVNNTQIIDTVMDFFNDFKTSISFPLALIGSSSSTVKFVNTASIATDRIVISHYELSYQREFNFGGRKNFPFELPAKPAGYYLEIAGFSAGASAPVLYDLTNNERLVADVSVPGLARFVLPGSASERKLVLVSEDASNLLTVNSMVNKNFVNFQDPANQGNYLIISSPLLYNGTNGVNPVNEYKLYRNSTAGGAFNAKVFEIDELVDQFAFGIKKHPLSVKNFIRYARNTFAAEPKFVLLIGHGLTYVDYRLNEGNPLADKLNIIPPFGYPGSDNKLSADGPVSSIITTPIGRLPAVSPQEVEDYLEKLKEYDYNQYTAPPTLGGRAWMKNVLHVTGASDPYLGTVLCNYVNSYKQIIEDTMVGANVFTVCKTSANPVEQMSNEQVASLFEQGLSMITYFGHSSSTTLEFNLDNPQNYANQGKYPVFSVNGCNAGNFFAFDAGRYLYNETISEKFTFAKKRGGIAFIASTHFGIVNYLNLFINSMYGNMSGVDYGKSLGEINRNALARVISLTGLDDYYARLHAEEITINGDPAIKMNFHVQPDYIIEEPQVKISPSFISIAETEFTVKAKLTNIGKSLGDSVNIEVRRQYPDGSVGTIFKDRIRGIMYSDSLTLTVPIVATRDKGLNRLFFTIDLDNEVLESSENNNTTTKDIYIYEDEARPVFPYNFSIINNPNQKLFASTANPFSNLKQYVMEIDTTELFNSAIKKVKNTSSIGGLLEFESGLSFSDSTVYFWRVGLVPPAGGEVRWNTYSFMYKTTNGPGFGQSHKYQHFKSGMERISLDSASGQWKFGVRLNDLLVRNTMYPTGGNEDNDFATVVNQHLGIASACVGRSIVFNVFDPITFKPWKNVDENHNNLYLYGSGSANCRGNRNWNFEFSYMTSASRKLIMDFMDSIPVGYYVVAKSFDYNNPGSFSATWRGDTSIYGSNKSLYHSLLAAGLTNIDSINQFRSWAMVYKKGDMNFMPKSQVSESIYDRIEILASCPTPDTVGFVTSPIWGPAKSWKELRWRGTSLETLGDNPSIQVIGIGSGNTQTVLYNLDKDTRDFDLSSIDATLFPSIMLKMRNVDSVNLSPFQLDYWRVTYDPVPEGAIAPNLYFAGKDTLEVGEKLNFGIAFKNISEAAFDSLKIKLYVLDKNNVPQYYNLPRTKPLISGDTIKVAYQFDTESLTEMNTLYIEFNSDNDQPEQYHFNNFAFRNFYVKPDKKNPFLDVTFDGVHILNRDIVSAKPNIQIKLKDDAKYLLLDDTALMTVQVRYPDQAGTLRTFNFNSDTLKFIPAASGSDNTASIEFGPYFPQILQADGSPMNPDGDEYELIIKGKDRSGNKSGLVEYRITFKVINKPMISNLLNYPNPFTTSTAFVFTITGSEIPSNLKIQILTVTGKIVREITKDELGPLHIGRNITEFKWDGTDQYGQKLGNGVYLYRFISTLNGKSMEKYRAEGDNTDKFFTNGYGKMYLMR